MLTQGKVAVCQIKQDGWQQHEYTFALQKNGMVSSNHALSGFVLVILSKHFCHSGRASGLQARWVHIHKLALIIHGFSDLRLQRPIYLLNYCWKRLYLLSMKYRSKMPDLLVDIGCLAIKRKKSESFMFFFICEKLHYLIGSH